MKIPYKVFSVPNSTLGAPTTSWILLADSQNLSFSTLIVKLISFFLIRQTSSTPQLGPACLLSKVEQASQAKLGRRWAWSDLNKIYIFEILMKNCTKYVSASSI